MFSIKKKTYFRYRIKKKKIKELENTKIRGIKLFARTNSDLSINMVKNRVKMLKNSLCIYIYERLFVHLFVYCLYFNRLSWNCGKCHSHVQKGFWRKKIEFIKIYCVMITNLIGYHGNLNVQNCIGLLIWEYDNGRKQYNMDCIKNL